MDVRTVFYIKSSSPFLTSPIRKWRKDFEYGSAKINVNVFWHFSDELRLQDESGINIETVALPVWFTVL